ncbi:MAG: allophanate hydrolase [Hyphomicrobiaceae bacterium]
MSGAEMSGVSIGALHAAYRAGTRPAAIIERLYGEIAAAGDPGIFITLREKDVALAAAERLGPFDPARYPLWGVPFAVKDNIDVAGLPTTCACPAYTRRPERSAHAVALLEAAGGICLGKTNLDQFATGLVGVRTPYPVPRNAIDPTLVPGGSSSGSAVAVARGLVTFALGTDTAGSGRVPAGLNNIVGLKPSVGAVSARGMVPACRTLDCISVFAGAVDDAWQVYRTMAGGDGEDPYSRPLQLGALTQVPPRPLLAVPRAGDLRFFGDVAAEAAFRAALDRLEEMGAILRPIDMTLLYQTAALLYEGAWVAERHAALRGFMSGHAEDMHPVTRRIVEGAQRFSASDLFDTMYKLEELRAAAAPVLTGFDALVVPTTPHAPTLADLAADPIGPNSELGTYTNFVNLLDLAAIAVPGPWRTDKRAAGITLIGPRGTDGRLASLGRAFHHRPGVTVGATGVALPAPATLVADAVGRTLEIAVVGAHLSGMPLNRELTALGATFVRRVATEPRYRLFALPGGPPYRPGLLRVAGDGAAIETEVWALPPAGFAQFVAAIPAPLGLGTLLLADGSRPKGFVVESVAVAEAEDVSSFGGWRAVMESRTMTSSHGKGPGSDNAGR